MANINKQNTNKQNKEKMEKITSQLNKGMKIEKENTKINNKERSINEVQIIDKAVDLIKKFEGFSEHVYTCPGGFKTIGYGFVVRNWDVNKIMERAEADTILTEKVQDLLLQTKNRLPALFALKLPSLCISCLLSFIYNIGLGAFMKSTLYRKLLSDSKPEVIKNEFLRWNKAGGKILKGLQKRREEESELFLSAYNK